MQEPLGGRARGVSGQEVGELHCHLLVPVVEELRDDEAVQQLSVLDGVAGEVGAEGVAGGGGAGGAGRGGPRGEGGWL